LLISTLATLSPWVLAVTGRGGRWRTALRHTRYRAARLLAAEQAVAHVVEKAARVVRLLRRAGGLLDGNVKNVLLTTLGVMGIELLDQRPFLGTGLPAETVLGARTPTPDEWADVRRGLAVARAAAEWSVGQTVVVRREAVSAVEAIEGTTAAIRRGTALSGPGAAIVKAVGAEHDFRFDVPTIGPETIEAAAEGGAAVVALEAERVFVLERETTTRRADAASIALVSTRGAGA